MPAIRLPGNLYYLSAKFPPRYGLYQKVAERLNEKGFRSSKGALFNEHLVSNIVRAAAHDYDGRVRKELIAMYAELENRTAEVEKYLTAAEKALGMEEKPALEEA